MKEAGKYKVWMDQSGGGLTLSGGEPLAQPAFALDIIRKAHAQKMHVALDSSGYGSFSQIQGCLDETDLVLLDIKTANPHLYPSLTGVRFHNTLETLDYLRSIEKPLWIRHVFVPGLTDQREDLTALLQLLKSVKTLERFELLPFHKMGEEKWAQIGERYTLTDTPAPDKERIRVVKERFRKEGIPIAD